MMQLTSNFSSLESQPRVDWRSLFEELYKGRHIYSYSSNQLIPMRSDEIWVVCRGVVQLLTIHPCGTEVCLGLISSSMPFGLPLTVVEPYDAIAMCDVNLMRLNVLEIEQSPQLSYSLFGHLHRRLQQTEALLAAANCRSVEERLQQVLLLFKQEIGQPTPEGTRLSVRLTHQHLANAIGSTRVTVTRALGQLQSRGWLTFDRDRHILIYA